MMTAVNCVDFCFNVPNSVPNSVSHVCSILFVNIRKFSAYIITCLCQFCQSFCLSVANRNVCSFNLHLICVIFRHAVVVVIKLSILLYCMCQGDISFVVN